MAIVNVTPDSFSDGGMLHVDDPDDPARAISHGLMLWERGADIVDVGGESTRPGATPVPGDVELGRVLPVVRELAAAGVVVSVDTTKPEVARRCLDAGAEIINDVSGLTDPAMVGVCREAGAGVVIMHMKGSPATMQIEPKYDDVTADVRSFLLTSAVAAEEAGIDRRAICLDPGIGFGKTFEHNLRLLADLEALTSSGYPVLVGTSRKGFLGAILDDSGYPAAPADRDPATAATIALAVAAGVSVVRVHDVVSGLQAARVADAIVRTHRQHERGGTWPD